MYYGLIYFMVYSLLIFLFMRFSIICLIHVSIYVRGILGFLVLCAFTAHDKFQNFHLFCSFNFLASRVWSFDDTNCRLFVHVEDCWLWFMNDRLSDSWSTDCWSFFASKELLFNLIRLLFRSFKNCVFFIIRIYVLIWVENVSKHTYLSKCVIYGYLVLFVCAVYSVVFEQQKSM